MGGMNQKPDGSYHWSCRIDQDFHRRSVKKGIWACLIIVGVILAVYAAVPSVPGGRKEIWIVLIPILAVAAVAVPLLVLQYTAADPHESYVMTEEYVKSGYGKGAVYAYFGKTKAMTVTSRYLELTGSHGSSRVYVPEGDMDFVREYVIKRLPEGTAVQYV